MGFLVNRRKKRLFIWITSIVLAIALILGACAIYLGDYYRADEGAIFPVDDVSVSTLENGNMVFEPQDSTVGIIFYPGGKVEYTAYYPLMAALAQEGITCILVEMPFNLAVLDIDAAEGIQAEYPKITDWYIGGHSLGGAMAASYLAENRTDYKGLILLGSYSTADLSDSEIGVLSIYGSEDKVLNAEKYAENRTNLPTGFTEFVIEGGCHAYFGMYGVQDGDGTPTISNQEQIDITAEKIAEFTN